MHGSVLYTYDAKLNQRPWGTRLHGLIPINKDIPYKVLWNLALPCGG